MTPAIIAFVVLLFIGAPVAVVMAMSGLAGGFAIGAETASANIKWVSS